MDEFNSSQQTQEGNGSLRGSVEKNIQNGIKKDT